MSGNFSPCEICEQPLCIVVETSPCAHIVIVIDKFYILRTRADAEGCLTVRLPFQLEGGHHSARVYLKCKCRRRYCCIGKFCFCVAPQLPICSTPTILTPENNAVITDRQPLITGIATPFSTVNVCLSGVGCQEVVANVSGAFSVQFPTELAPGSYTITATSSRAEVCCQSQEAISHFQVEGLIFVPAPVIVSPADGAVISDHRPFITGTGVPGLTVEVCLTGQGCIDTVVNENGQFSVQFPSTLPDGTYTVTAQQKDNAGHVSDIVVSTFTVVTFPIVPPPAIVSPADGAVISDHMPFITGTGLPGFTVEVCLTDQGCIDTLVDENGDFSVQFPSPLPDGSYTVTAQQKDAMGHVSDIVVSTFTVITLPVIPPPVIVSPADGAVISDHMPFITGTGVAELTVQVCLSGQGCLDTLVDLDGQFSVQFPDLLPDGPYTVTAQQRDNMGNVSTIVTSTFTVITIPVFVPPPVIVSPADGAVITNHMPFITGLGLPGFTVEVCLNGQGCLDATVDDNGGFSVQFPSPLPDATYTVTAQQRDNVGNVSTIVTSTFTVTTLPIVIPPPVILTPEDGSVIADPTPFITGLGVPGLTVQVCLSGQGCLDALVDEDGHFSVQFPSALPDGPYTVTAQQRDNMGNISTIVTSTFTVETAVLSFTFTNAQTGSTFRTIDLEFDVANFAGPITVYYLLLPPGSPAPTVDEVINYNDVASLTDGAAARGNFVLNAVLPGGHFDVTITGKQNVTPVPGETGIVDGYRYNVYVVGVISATENTGVLGFAGAILGMPFAGGNGSAATPYIIRELTLAELVNYPDLLAGNPLNLTGVNETARMLDNIERLEVLFDQTDGVYGLIDSLSLAYVLSSPIDLSDYADAYNGEGWRPIGNADAFFSNPGITGVHRFTGSFTGGASATPITNLVMNRTASITSQVLNTGLFGVALGATFTDVTISGVTIQASSSPSNNAADLAAIGSLVGSAQNTMFFNVTVENATITASIATGVNYSYIGGVAGLVLESATLDSIAVQSVNITDPLRRNSYIGGMVGSADQTGGVLTLQNSSVVGAQLSGNYRMGGSIGNMPNGITNAANVQIDSVIINSSGNSLGGFVGRLGGAIASTLQNITTANININIQSPATSFFVGGLIGVAEMNGSLLINLCSVTGISLNAGGDVGGFAGALIALAGSAITMTDCAAASVAVIGTSSYIGGFAGALAIEGGITITVTNCTCVTTIPVQGGSDLGGFVGLVNGTSFITVPVIFTNCSTTAPTEQSTGAFCGGFGGACYAGIFSGCSASGSVSGRNIAGGFVGRGTGTANPDNTGHTFVIDNCVSSSSITATLDTIGGVVGTGMSIEITNCSTVFNQTVSVNVLGGIVGLIAGVSLISNCTSTIAISGITTRRFAGGIVGEANNTTNLIIENCVTEGSIAAFDFAGGILGAAATSTVATITSCASSVSITSTSNNIGGIVGTAYYSTDLTQSFITISNCHSSGNVSGNNYIGGIIGNAERNTRITDCYTTGSGVSATSGLGGIAGRALNNCLIASCTSAMNLSGASNVGGIVGTLSTISISAPIALVQNCYATGSVRGGVNSVGGIGGTLTNNVLLDKCYARNAVTGDTTSTATGGVAGTIATGATVSNSYAINPSITVPAGNTVAGRIIGANSGGGITTNNYAWDGIVISGFVPVNDGNGKDGLALPASALTRPSTDYVALTAWDFTNIWTYSAVPAVNLPILIGIAQNVQTPSLP